MARDVNSQGSSALVKANLRFENVYPPGLPDYKQVRRNGKYLGRAKQRSGVYPLDLAVKHQLDLELAFIEVAVPDANAPYRALISCASASSGTLGLITARSTH